MLIYNYWSIPSEYFNGSFSISIRNKEVNMYNVFMFVFPTVLIVYGIPSNILTFIVLKRKSVRGYVLSVYLQCLCVINTLALFSSTGLHWIQVMTSVDFRLTSYNACFMLLCLFSLALCYWSQVVIKAYRLFSTYSPTRSVKYFSPPRHIFIILFLTMLLGLANWIIVFHNIYVEPKMKFSGPLTMCYLGRPDSSTALIYMSFFLFLPAFLLICLKLVLRKIRKRRLSWGMQLGNTTITTGNYLISLVHLTDMQFLICAMPLLVFNVVRLAGDSPSNSSEAFSVMIGHSVCVMILYSSNSGYLLLFGVFKVRYRVEVSKTFQHLCSMLCDVFGSDTSSDSNLSNLSPSLPLPDENPYSRKPTVLAVFRDHIMETNAASSVISLDIQTSPEAVVTTTLTRGHLTVKDLSISKFYPTKL